MSGKPWDKKGTYSTFEEADEVRYLYLNSSEEIQAKVRRTAEGTFLVKTRVHPDLECKEEKKSGKNRRRNKKNSNRRMYDASADF